MSFDAVLLLSFGGPEGPEQVRPFLENVTRGRGVPAQRLDDVAGHYLHFGGVSPINAINRALVEQLREHCGLPVYFGNRNWEPYVEDAVAQMTADGVCRAAVFPTSAWGGYSGCGQYAEDLARARAVIGSGAPELIKLGQYFDHPLLVEMFAEAITVAAAGLPPQRRDDARLVFTAHSVPDAADIDYGPRLYSRQVARTAELVAGAVARRDYDRVWQSRSGPPRVRWLEPDIEDHLESLIAAGARALIVCPIGFVSANIEVLWDLDTEVRRQAEWAGMAYARAATPDADPRFARLACDLIDRARGAVGQESVTDLRCGPARNGAPCGGAHCAGRVQSRRPG